MSQTFLCREILAVKCRPTSAPRQSQCAVRAADSRLLSVTQADRHEGRREEKGDGLASAERDELARLRRENKQLRLERDILGFSSSPCKK
jgi:transposase-like protein